MRGWQRGRAAASVGRALGGGPSHRTRAPGSAGRAPTETAALNWLKAGGRIPAPDQVRVCGTVGARFLALPRTGRTVITWLARGPGDAPSAGWSRDYPGH